MFWVQATEWQQSVITGSFLIYLFIFTHERAFSKPSSLCNAVPQCASNQHRAGHMQPPELIKCSLKPAWNFELTRRCSSHANMPASCKSVSEPAEYLHLHKTRTTVFSHSQSLQQKKKKTPLYCDWEWVCGDGQTGEERRECGRKGGNKCWSLWRCFGPKPTKHLTNQPPKPTKFLPQPWCAATTLPLTCLTRSTTKEKISISW